MDLSSLEAAATISKHAVVLLASGGAIAGYRAWYFAVKKVEAKRLHAQFAVVLLAALGACAGYSVYYFTDEIGLERERITKDKEAKFERFKAEKDAEIKSAIAQAAEANARAAEANRIAEGERLERVKLEEKLAWRSLSADQHKRIVAKLSKFSGTPFQLRVFQDPESLKFMNQIADILHSATWTQLPIVAAMEISSKYGTVGVSLSAGVIITVDMSRESDLGPAGKALATALDAERIASEFKVAKIERQAERIHIQVGKKP
jgi:uncharacterized OsmC-like protein